MGINVLVLALLCAVLVLQLERVYQALRKLRLELTTARWERGQRERLRREIEGEG